MNTNNKTTKEVLGVIAKELHKIAKELKKTNEPTYVLTEKGKALLEQSCEEVSNTPSNNELREAAKLLKEYCKNHGNCCDNANGTCMFYRKADEVCIFDISVSPQDWEV